LSNFNEESKGFIKDERNFVSSQKRDYSPLLLNGLFID